MNHYDLKNIINRVKAKIDNSNVIVEYILQPIEKSKIPNPIKTILKIIVSIVFRKKDFYSFAIAYIRIGGTILITRSGLLICIIQHTVGDDNIVGNLLIGLAEYLEGTVDNAVFWGLTIVAILVTICHCIVNKQEQNLKKELNALLESITFNPDENWFDNKCNIAIKTLGSRYSEENNFLIPKLSIIYTALVQPEYFDINFKRTLTSFLRECKSLYTKWGQSYCDEQKDIELKSQEIVEIYNNRMYAKYFDIFQNTKAINEIFRTIHFNDNDTVSKYELNKIQDKLGLLDVYKEVCQFSSYPVIYIKGEAGTGKSHLLADIVKTRMNNGLKSIFILGLDFYENSDIKNRILEILGVKVTWDDFLNTLNQIAKLKKHRILIVVDGINEGSGRNCWKQHIAGIEKDILQYEYLGLVVSARTFSNVNMLDVVSQNKASITLEGFRGMEDEAITYLADKFKVTLPNLSQFRKEFSNPLFLTLYCKTYGKNVNQSPSSFGDIAHNYINMVNEKLSEKYKYEASLYNYANQTVDALLDIFKSQSSPQMTKYQLFDDLLAKVNCNCILPNGMANSYLQDLIDEGVLMSYYDSKDRILIDFNFDLVGDYLYAEALLKANWHDYVGRVFDNGIYEATAVLLPIIKKVEIFDYNCTNISLNYREKLFVDTLNQRFSITLDALNKIDVIQSIDKNRFYEIIPLITVFESSNKIFDKINADLKQLSMINRDVDWSMHFTINCPDHSKTELLKLAKWASSISRTSARHIQDTVAYQMSCLLCWSFSVPYRLLRDIATMAVINLVQDKPQILLKLIDLFDDVNDPYIQQRLYAVVHGAVFKGDCCMSIDICKKIYDKVFNSGPVRPDILLRDYARLSVEHIVQHNDNAGIDIEKINPPYGVHFDFSQCPDRATVEAKYRLKNGMSYSADEIMVQNAILDSMETEYSNGIAGYGDFGRYVFEKALQNWEKCVGYSASNLRNYALELIFSKYQYDPKQYKIHDKVFYNYFRTSSDIERFGKKLQWIALYEILGLLQDNYKMTPYFNDSNEVNCDGPWDPCVRDIDTTVTFSGYHYHNLLVHRSNKLKWTNTQVIPFEIKNPKSWLSNKEGLSKETIKNTIEIKDESGDSWIVLYGYNTMVAETKDLIVDDEENVLWEFIQAYIVKRSERNAVAKLISKIGTGGRCMPEYNNSFNELYYKDYYKSSSYQTYAEKNGLDDWDELEGSELKFRIAYCPYGFKEERTIKRLKKVLYEALDLHDGISDGEYVDKSGNIIAFDPSVNNQNDSQLLIRKDSLMRALKENGLSVVWPILCEKQKGSGSVGNQFGGCAYITDNGKIKVCLRHYERSRDSFRKNVYKTKIVLYGKLLWYIVTFNKKSKKKTVHEIKIADDEFDQMLNK